MLYLKQLHCGKLMHTHLQNTYRFTKNIFNRFLDDGCLYRASALTYTSLLALVPLMLVMLFVLKVFPVFSSWGQTIQDFIFANFIPATGEVTNTYLVGFGEQAGQLSAIGLVILLVTAVLMLFNIEQAFNIIWRVEKRPYGLSSFLLYWALLTLAPLFMGVSLAISSYFFSISFIAGAVTKYGLLKIILSILPFVLSIIVFTILYVAIPNCRVPFRYGLISAIFSATLFQLAKYGFAIYLLNSHTYQILYGALAVIPIFLLWIYSLIWFINIILYLYEYTIKYYFT